MSKKFQLQKKPSSAPPAQPSAPEASVPPRADKPKAGPPEKSSEESEDKQAAFDAAVKRYDQMITDLKAENEGLQAQVRRLQEEKKQVQARIDAYGLESDGKVPYLSIVSTSERGFWRCKRKFTRQETLIPVAELEDRELDALMSDGNLSVRRVMREE